MTDYYDTWLSLDFLNWKQKYALEKIANSKGIKFLEKIKKNPSIAFCFSEILALEEPDPLESYYEEQSANLWYEILEVEKWINKAIRLLTVRKESCLHVDWLKDKNKYLEIMLTSEKTCSFKSNETKIEEYLRQFQLTAYPTHCH